MTNAFQAAASKIGTGPIKRANNSDVITPSDPDIRKAVDEFITAKDEEKQAKARKDSAKGVVTQFAMDEFFNRFSQNGVKPDKGLLIQGESKQARLVVQDKGEDERYFITDDQMEMLRNLMTDDQIKTFLIEHTRFSFNPNILAKEGVMDALGNCIQDMVTAGTITAAEAAELLSAKKVRTIKKGTIDRLPSICDGGGAEKMAQVFDLLGSCVTAYVR